MGNETKTWVHLLLVKGLPAPWIFWLALGAGVIPIIATHAALLLNLLAPDPLLGDAFHCMPYWDGCVSVSRAVRSGPGLPLFRALMLPAAAALALTWISAGRWLAQLQPDAETNAGRLSAMGVIGALFLVLYVSALGTEGAWYGWMRRYGVVVYFGLTALAQLLFVHALWPLRGEPPLRHLRRPLRALFALVLVEWLGGVASVAKRVVLSDAALINRVENVIEWWFALALSAAFVMVALVMRGASRQSTGGTSSR